jgi:quercetin dioxygenase-like cupin family protein
LQRPTEKLRGEPAWKAEGHSATTIVKYPDLRIVLLALRAKAVMKEHRADARISVQTLTGHARLHLPDRVVDLPAGRGVALERSLPHDVEAIDDSALLLTLSWPTAPTSAAEESP